MVSRSACQGSVAHLTRADRPDPDAPSADAAQRPALVRFRTPKDTKMSPG